MFDLRQYKDNIAIITDRGICVSYRELLNAQEKLFNLIKERELVLILCDNVLGSLIGYTCCMINRVVPILVDCNINRERLNNLLNLYRPNYVWMPRYLNLFNNTKAIYENWEYKLVPYTLDKKHNIYEELALLLPTSGSTGSAKMVRLSYENIRENAKSIIQYLNIKSSDRAITSLPMCYTFGLSIINTHLYTGACILLTNKKVFDIKFWLFFNTYSGTSISGVPYKYSIMKKMNIGNMNLPTLNTLTQAGGKLTKEECKYFVDFACKNNCRFYVMYGQTEATARISYVPYDMVKEKMSSIGISVPGGTLELRDMKKNKICTPYLVGELVYRGKNVSLGYAHNFKDLILGDDNKHILYTGDLGYFDNDNYFYLTGRIDRIIKILGYRVSLDELEKILEDKFLNKFVCLHIHDMIYIVGDSLINENEIISYLSLVTNIHNSLFQYVFMPEIPRTYNGKVDYARLKQF